MGICEAHAVTSAAGLAISGFIPVVAFIRRFYSAPTIRLFTMLRCRIYTLCFALTAQVVVGDDGETHQGVFDLAFMRQIPNMAVLAPASFYELEHMLKYAVLKHKGPICIRYPRGTGSSLRARR